MKKRLIGLVLVATMLFGTTMSVSAVNSALTTTEVTSISNNGISVTMDGTVKKPTIKVTVTKNGDVIANPYEMEVEYKSVTDNSVTLKGKKTLLPASIGFKNESDVPIAVGLTGSLKLPAGVTVGTKAAIDTATTKQVYVEGRVTVKEDEPKKVQKQNGTAVNPLVYSVAGTALTEANMPVMAAKNQKTGAQAEEILLIIEGKTSVGTAIEWNPEKDKFSVITKYNLKFMSSKQYISTFVE